MNNERIWQEVEVMLEEESGYSMRELMRNREAIEEGLKDKFSTQAVLGEDCFAKVVKHLEEERPANWVLSELCIRRKYVIKNLKTKSKRDNLLEIDVCKAEKLWAIIENKVLPMEIFWSMEYSEGNDVELTDEEKEVLSYMREIANIYLGKTEIISNYAIELNVSLGI